jgi:hypothetical protein
MGRRETLAEELVVAGEYVLDQLIYKGHHANDSESSLINRIPAWDFPVTWPIIGLPRCRFIIAIALLWTPLAFFLSLSLKIETWIQPRPCWQVKILSQ